MTQPDPCSVVRIAITLATLKHKPKDQSTASYLLDLHSRFPLTNKDNDDREWRAYALELEKQLSALKAQRDADQELLLRHQTDASQAASTSDAPPPKKKSKKNTAKEQHCPEWSWDQTRADWTRVLSSQYPSSPSLVAAYASLQGVLASSNADHVAYAPRLTDATLRALDTIHVFLFSAPNPSLDSRVQTALGAPVQLEPEHIDSARIALASPLLMYVLRAALHALVRTAQESARSRRQRRQTAATTADVYMFVDKVIDRLLERVFLFLLRALVPLCSARLAPLLSTPARKDKNKGKTSRTVTKGKEKEKDRRAGSVSVDHPKKTNDARADVFALIGASFEALDTLPSFPSLAPSPGTCGGSIAGDVRDRLGLETIRELEALYVVPLAATRQDPPSPTPQSAQSQSQSQSHSQPQLRHGADARARRLEKLTGTRAERVKALATRDAGWFLASTLDLCVIPPSGEVRVPRDSGVAGTTGNAGGLLREALLDRIGKLVRSVPASGRQGGHGQQTSSEAPRDDQASVNVADCKLVIDPVCQNMLLAICERAIGQLAPS